MLQVAILFVDKAGLASPKVSLNSELYANYLSNIFKQRHTDCRGIFGTYNFRKALVVTT